MVARKEWTWQAKARFGQVLFMQVFDLLQVFLEGVMRLAGGFGLLGVQGVNGPQVFLEHLVVKKEQGR